MREKVIIKGMREKEEQEGKKIYSEKRGVRRREMRENIIVKMNGRERGMRRKREKEREKEREMRENVIIKVIREKKERNSEWDERK